MTAAELAELSGAEVVSRLVNRGVAPWYARRLVEGREQRPQRDAILRVLNWKGHHDG